MLGDIYNHRVTPFWSKREDTLACGGGGGETQFRRRDRHSGTLSSINYNPPTPAALNVRSSKCTHKGRKNRQRNLALRQCLADFRFCPRTKRKNATLKKCHKLLHKAMTQQRFFPLFTKRRYGEKTVLIQCEPEIVLIFQENNPKNVRKSTTTGDNGSVIYHFDNTW